MPLFESNGKKYNIPPDKVEYFLSKRTDARPIPNLSPQKDFLDVEQIKGKQTPVAGFTPLNAAQMQTNGWSSAAGDVAEKVGGGITKQAGGLLTVAENLFKGSSIPITEGGDYIPESVIESSSKGDYKQEYLGLGEKLQDKGAEVSERGDRYGNIIDKETGELRKKQYSDLWREGNYLGALGEIMLTGAESAPTSVAAMLPGGLALVSASAAGQKYNELNSNPETKDMPEWKKWLNAATSGALEGLTEKVGAKVDMKMIEPFLSKMGEQAVKQILAKGGINALIQTITEGGEEVLSQLGENVIDYATGASNEYKPLEGVGDAFVYGAGGGAQFGGATLGASGYRAAQVANYNRNVRKNYNSATENIYSNLGKEEADGVVSYVNDIISKGDEGSINRVIKNAIKDEDLTDDQKRSILNYVYAANENNKISSSRKAKVDQEVSNATQAVDNEMNESTGTLMSAKIGKGDNAEEVQITKGNIVISEDGAINLNESDKEVYYKDRNGDTQVIGIDMIGEVTENVPRDEAIRQVTAPILEDGQAQEANDSALASQNFNEGDIVYFADPGSNVAIDVQLQDVGENGMYIGMDASGNQIEVEPRLVMSEQDYLSSMNNDEVEQSIFALNQSLSSGALDGNMSGRMLDQRAKLEKELQRRAQQGAPLSTSAEANSQNNTSNPNESEGIASGEYEQASQNAQNIKQSDIIANPDIDGTIAESSQISQTDSSVPIASETRVDAFADFPRNKKGEVDVDNLSSEQQLQFAEATVGEDFAIDQAGRSIKGLEKKRDALSKKLEGETNMAKAANIQKEIDGVNNSIVVYKEYREARNYRESQEEKSVSFAERLKRLSEPISLEDTIAQWVASGGKIRWSDNVSNGAITSRGFGNHLGYSNVERKSFLGITSNQGMTPEQLAHYIWENTDSDSVVAGMDTQDILNVILDVIPQLNTRKAALEFSEGMRQSGRENLAEQQRAFEESLIGKNETSPNIEAKSGSFVGIPPSFDIDRGIAPTNEPLPFQNTQQRFKPISEKKLNKLVERLKATDLAMDVIALDGDAFAEKVESENGAPLQTNGTVYGFVNPDGVIYLNKDSMNANTPIHEFGHLWNSFVKDSNPDLYSRGADLIKQSEYWQKVNENPAYRNLSDEAKIDEALAMAIGDKGEQIENRGLNQQFKDWLSDIWNSIKEAFGVSERLDIQDMTLEGFTDLATRKLLGGSAVNLENNITRRDNSLSLHGIINNDGSVNYGRLEDIGSRIAKGDGRLDRLSLEEERGRNAGGRRNVEASTILAADERANSEKIRDAGAGATGKRAGGKFGNARRQEQRLKDYAKSVGIWIDSKDIDSWEHIDSGMEARVYKDKTPGFVRKVLYNYPNFSETPLEYLDNRISLHNYLFPESPYELVGFTETYGANRNVPGTFFAPVVRQKYISGNGINESDIPAFKEEMKRRGFEDKGGNTYASDDYIIDDLHTDNVMVDDAGNYFFIDTSAQLNTPNEGYGGVREYGSGDILDTSDNREILVDENEQNESNVQDTQSPLLAKGSTRNQLDWPSDLEYISQMESDAELEQSRKGANYDANPKDGITFAERQMTDQGNLTFMGDPLTGASEIKSSADVAWLFKNLESAATENSFLVMIREDGSYAVYYASTGATSGTVADIKLLAAAAKDYGANRVCFVHNHPSGNLLPSGADMAVHKNVKESMNLIGIETLDSVVINLDSGQYLEFDEYEGGTRAAKGVPDDIIQPKVFSFDRQALYVPINEKVTITSSVDIAKFLSQQKRGAIPKISAIIMDMSNRINRYVFFDPNMSSRELIGSLLYEAGKHGDRVILSSNGDLGSGLIQKIKNSLKKADVYLIDVLEVHQDAEILNNYKSFADEGLMEPTADYSDGNVDIIALANNVVKKNEVGAAEAETNINPTEAQKEAGNYKKGHVNINGFDISIEQPKGSIRSGVDENGNPWEAEMKNTYGYIRGTDGRDGDQIDVFLGNNLNSDKIFVVDQVNPETLEFDEHKVMMGFNSAEEARDAYLSNYESDWNGLGDITETDTESFRKWASSDGRRMKPFGDYGGSGVRFQIDNEPNTIEAEEARRHLNAKLHSLKYRLNENWIDSDLPVKTFFDELRKLGVKISSANDFYQNVTHVAGINDEELKRYQSGLFKKVIDSISDVMKTGKSRRDVDNYVMLKHGLERNEYMRKKEVEEYKQKLLAEIPDKLAEWEKAHPESTEDDLKKREIKEKLRINNKVDNKREGLKNKDYSGLSAVENEIGKTAQEFIDLFEREVGSINDALINDFWKNIQGATNYSLNKLVQGGVLSAKVADELKNRYQYYVPLRGHDELTAEDVYDYTSMMGTFYSSPIKTAKGRKSRADDPFAYIQQMAQTAINTGNFNLLKQGLLRIAQNQDTKGLMSADDAWYQKVGEDETGRPEWEIRYPEYSDNASRYEKNIEKFNEHMKNLEESGMARQSGAKFDIGGMFIKRPQKDEHVVRVFQNGKEHTIYINANPRISRAINGMNKITPSELSNRVGRVSRWMASNMTSRNPAFVATNFARDYGYGSAATLAKEGAKYAANFQKNVPAAMGTLTRHFAGKGSPSSNRYDQYLFEFLSNGGKTGFTNILELERTKKDINKELDSLSNPNVYNSALKAGEAILDFLQIGNDVAENTTRLATYITSREMGRDVQRSISDAKEVTVNFNRKGAGGMGAADIRPLYLFLNAGLQGLSNFSKVVKNAPKAMSGIIGFYALSGFLQPMLAYLIGGDEGEDEYWKIPEHDRKQNFIIPTGGGNFIKIPISHELRLFHSIGETAAAVFKGRKDAADGLLDGMQAMSDILPLDPMSANDAGIENVITPDLVKPIIQAATNKSWTGSPVYNEWANEAFPGYRNIRTNKKGEPYAPEWIVSFSKVLDKLSGGDGTQKGLVSPNPDVLNHYAKGYIGGLYTLAAQGVDLGGKTIEGKSVQSKDIPFANRFFIGNDDLRLIPDDLSEKFYSAKKEVKDANSFLKDYEKRAKSGEVDLIDYAERISELRNIVGLNDELKIIEKEEGDLKKLSGEEQKDAERRIAESKVMWLELYNEVIKNK